MDVHTIWARIYLLWLIEACPMFDIETLAFGFRHALICLPLKSICMDGPFNVEFFMISHGKTNHATLDIRNS